MIATATLCRIAVVRAYFLLFTGARHASTVSLGIGLRERIAVLILSGLILGGGIFPQPNVSSRQRAAEEILQDRWERPSIDHRVDTNGQGPPRAGVGGRLAQEAPDSERVPRAAGSPAGSRPDTQHRQQRKVAVEDQ